ncbi:MAG TPA: CPBP family glutamic-type intramembrane protease [Jiangellaceae bacterium]|nr:CPBP family glutamic-type intramembrane protease [Jiangellaceae bacterium]
MSEPYDPYGLPPEGSPPPGGRPLPPGQGAPPGTYGWPGQQPAGPQWPGRQEWPQQPAGQQWPSSQQPWPSPYAPAPAQPVHSKPQPYHLLLLTPTYKWWRPLLGLAIFGATFTVLTIGVTVTFIVADLIRTGGPVEESIDRFGTEMDPLFLLATNLGLAVAIPAAVLAIVVAHRMRPGWLSSVAGRLRWGLLLRMSALALTMVVLFTIVGGWLVPMDDGALDLEDVQVVSLSTWFGFAVVIILTTPLQAAAEEYAFRGYGMQALGALFRTPWVGAIVTSLAFAFAHGVQNMPLFLDRLAFGLIACWLVVRTGGLEAAIAMHVMNNMVVFLISAAFDQVDDTLQVSSIPWVAVIIDVAQMAVFALLADRYVRRRGLPTRSQV